MPRVHQGGGWSPVGSENNNGVSRTITVLSTNKSSAASAKANRGDNNNALPIFRRLRPVHARGARTAAQQHVGDANAYDRSDQGVRARGLVTAFRANTASRPEGNSAALFIKKQGAGSWRPISPLDGALPKLDRQGV
jgi:hypothetical protein